MRLGKSLGVEKKSKCTGLFLELEAAGLTCSRPEDPTAGGDEHRKAPLFHWPGSGGASSSSSAAQKTKTKDTLLQRSLTGRLQQPGRRLRGWAESGERKGGAAQEQRSSQWEERRGREGRPVKEAAGSGVSRVTPLAHRKLLKRSCSTVFGSVWEHVIRSDLQGSVTDPDPDPDQTPERADPASGSSCHCGSLQPPVLIQQPQKSSRKVPLWKGRSLNTSHCLSSTFDFMLNWKIWTHYSRSSGPHGEVTPFYCELWTHPTGRDQKLLHQGLKTPFNCHRVSTTNTGLLNVDRHFTETGLQNKSKHKNEIKLFS